MPLDSNSGAHFGNLQAYKFYIRPTAHRLFGSSHYQKKSTTKHHENAQKLLETLALNGPLTTWEMAKVELFDNISLLKNREKVYRRLLIGRRDLGKWSGGIMDVGLVVKAGILHRRGPSTQYQLSLHGILYCLDVLDLSNDKIDVLATKYDKVLPKIFGKWDYLKSKIDDSVYNLKLLAKGFILDNVQFAEIAGVPFYELMAFLRTKYSKNFEYILERELADQISYWFYTNLLFNPDFSSFEKTGSISTQRSKSLFDGDKELMKWYLDFIQEAKQFYKKAAQTLEESTFSRVN